MFKDHFSGHAADYSQARPSYPPELFTYLSSLVNAKDLVWDCATGNGQAAAELATIFKKVIATDASAQQIEKAVKKDNIEYWVASAENSGLENSSVDLITVAQALHWFDLEKFYEEAKRVLKPKGILATWCYVLFHTDNEELNKFVNEFYWDIIGPYWPPDRKYIEEHYENILFPFEEIKAPEFSIQNSWTLEQLMNYMQTWSSVKNYEKKEGINPVKDWLIPRVSHLSKTNEQKFLVTMPLYFKITRL